MSQILKDLNKLAAKMGAPVVGRNISEQVRAISTYYDGTSHGANIAERINEVAHSNIGSGSAVLISKTINQNGNYSATDDEADGYSDVKVNVQPTLTTKSITANGTYNAASDEADGYSSVSVNVPGIAMPDYIKNGLRIFIQPNTVASSSNVPVIGKESVFEIDEDESLDLSNGATISTVFKIPSNYNAEAWNKIHEVFMSNGSRIITGIRYYNSAVRVFLNGYVGRTADEGWARDVAVIEPGAYVHVTTVYLFDNARTIKFYINGILAYTATGVGSSTSYLNNAIVNQFSILQSCYTASVLLGADRHPPSSTYLDCTLYDRILTDQEVASNYNAADTAYNLSSS
jgi:hypothetical protein